MSLARTETLLERKERDEISRGDQEWLSHHILECPLCHERALLLDPLVAFTPLSASGDPEALAFGLEPATGEQQQMAFTASRTVHLEILRRRFRPARGPAFLLAASFLLTAAGLTVIFSRGRFLDGEAGPASALKTVPPVAEMPGIIEARLPWIEGVENPEAKVYQFTPSSRKEPMVVFVVDQNVEF